ncbi:MAG: hypothetical protein Tsb002_28140 [Wenzhouxiangellaceae bacterium]
MDNAEYIPSHNDASLEGQDMNQWMEPSFLVHRAFWKHASQTPERLALAYQDERWTYGELANTIQVVADNLMLQGIGRGDVVVAECERNVSLVVVMMAVIRVGATFLVIAERNPCVYTARVLESVEKVYWISTKDDAESKDKVLRMLGGKIVQFIQYRRANLRKIKARTQYHLLADEVTEEDHDLYLISTSGSTGKPKLINGTHKPVTHFIQWYIKRFNLTPDDRFSFLSGIGYDPMLRDLLVPLSCGGSLWIPSESDLNTRHGVIRWISKNNLNVMHLTPALAEIVFDASESVELPDLKLVAIGGGPLLVVKAQGVSRLAPNADVVNFYGATETPQIMCYHLCQYGDQADDEQIKSGNEIVPLGQPISDVHIYIVNDEGKGCRVNEVGEIYVRSAYLSKGYYNNPEQSAKVFFEADVEHSQDKVYKTGDLGCVGEDGLIRFMGRKDRQIKFKSYRIQPEEIEYTLKNCPGVKQSGVVVEHPGEDDERLICFIEEEGTGNLSISEVKKYLIERLPVYMLPSEYIPVDSIPRTINGKIDLVALSKMRKAQASEQLTSKKPNEVEKKILNIWSEILELDPGSISLTSNFFDVGGNSLLAAKLIANLQSEFDKEILITDLFLYPNVKEMTQYIAVEDQAGKTVKADAMRNKNRLGRIAASRARRMKVQS